MSGMDKLKNAAQGLRGAAKRSTGKATNNPRLRREGRKDELAADLKQAGEKVKDAFKKR